MPSPLPGPWHTRTRLHAHTCRPTTTHSSFQTAGLTASARGHTHNHARVRIFWSPGLSGWDAGEGAEQSGRREERQRGWRGAGKKGKGRNAEMERKKRGEESGEPRRRPGRAGKGATAALGREAVGRGGAGNGGKRVELPDSSVTSEPLAQLLPDVSPPPPPPASVFK